MVNANLTEIIILQVRNLKQNKYSAMMTMFVALKTTYFLSFLFFRNKQIPNPTKLKSTTSPMDPPEMIAIKSSAGR